MNSGYLINPRAAAEQMEDSVVWELSHTLYGGLELEQGRFVNTNFDSYKLMRMHQAPEVEVHFVMSEDGWWGGMGEPAGPAGSACRGQRHLLSHRQTRSLDADQRVRPELVLADGGASRPPASSSGWERVTVGNSTHGGPGVGSPTSRT
jgi:hypothetical protein